MGMVLLYFEVQNIALGLSTVISPFSGLLMLHGPFKIDLKL